MLLSVLEEMRFVILGPIKYGIHYVPPPKVKGGILVSVRIPGVWVTVCIYHIS